MDRSKLPGAVAATMVRNKGSVQAQQVEIAANKMVNNGQFEALDMMVETDRSIYNSFGGNIKSNTLVVNIPGASPSANAELTS